MNKNRNAALCFLMGFSLLTLPAAEKPAGKQELFNGKDFTGWKIFMSGNADPTATWSVRDGVIHCAGKPAGYIRTEGVYRDYKLTVQWRFLKPGNTGVLLHASGPDKIWPRSIEAQGMSKNQGDIWLIDGTEIAEHKGKEGRRVPKTGPSNEKETGEWNTYELVCKGDTIQLFVNGKLMNQGTEASVTEGSICLQSEGGEIEIRKVTLEPAN